jgi:class 3 adenylate cyclase
MYPETTVFFADIAGFTSWSSERSPVAVFTLLETIYSEFDAIARKRRVFKVETIGDCYVAVGGLPEPTKDHEVAMCRFARDCRIKMNELTNSLESMLGPGTADSRLRIALHSGAVTAGVLRGERSRFQVSLPRSCSTFMIALPEAMVAHVSHYPLCPAFGDTVNTASRMESVPNKILCSQKTADRLITAGNGHWLTARKDLVDAKGKGLLQTYWVEPFVNRSSIDTAVSSSDESTDVVNENVSALPIADTKVPQKRIGRLVDWNVEMFSALLNHRVSQSSGVSLSLTNRTSSGQSSGVSLSLTNRTSSASAWPRVSTKPRSEASDAVPWPPSDDAADCPTLLPTDAALHQLRDMISVIGCLYRDNPFHSFEHASHVTMSTMKLMQRELRRERLCLEGLFL